MSKIARTGLSIFLVLFSTTVFAQKNPDQTFLSYTMSTGTMNGDFVMFDSIADSIEYDDYVSTTVTAEPPAIQEFEFSFAATFKGNAGGESPLESTFASVSKGGWVTSIYKSSISGVLNNPQAKYSKTYVVGDREFDNEQLFLSIGQVSSDGVVEGYTYQQLVSPAQLEVSEYLKESVIIDPEFKIQLVGVFIRWDTIQMLLSGYEPAFASKVYEGSLGRLHFGWDADAGGGLVHSSIGPDVISGYKDQTGKDLKEEGFLANLGIGAHSAYKVGLFYDTKVEGYSIAAGVGAQGVVSAYAIGFLDGDEEKGTNSTSYLDSTKAGGSMAGSATLSYGPFFQMAMLF